MVRIKATGRKSTGSQRPAVWHRLLIAAADLGSWEALLAGLEAEEEWVSLVWYRVHRKAEERHPAADVGVDASTLPFPLTSSFGLLPYAAFRGHKEIVAGFCAAGFEAAGTARVLTVLYSEAWARGGLHLPRVGHFHDDTPEGQFDNVRANALQIAHYKRDAAIVRLLRQVPGMPLVHPFLLDLIKPQPGSVLASQKGTWSTAFHPVCPPAFKAATAELLRISSKHGGTVGPNGRLRWAFTPATLVELLLPALADDMSAWLDGVPSEAQWLASQEGDEAGEAAAEDEESE